MKLEVLWLLAWLVASTGGLSGGEAQQPRHLSNSAPEKHATNVRLKPGESVEVLLFGAWTKGKLLAIDGKQFNVELPDGTKYWMEADEVRKIVVPTPPGQPPKPGLSKCAGKFDGRYSTDTGYPVIIFRHGTASVQGDAAVECWIGHGKIYLHAPGTRADQDFVMTVLKNGALDTPLGEIRKKDKE